MLGPELLGGPLLVALDDGVRDVEDGLRGAVVLLQGDGASVGIVAFEGEDVPDVSSSKAVDGVVGDEPVGDEVVRPLDVEVEYSSRNVHALDSLDDVIAAFIVEHDHARNN